jgi:two-component system sensor histidine kinase PilS (NtrC family)
MHSIFDERLWLAWVVKVRIIILTFLLGIELAVARLSPSTMPLRLFVSTMMLWYTVSVFYLLLLSFWREHRVQSVLQVVTDMVLVSVVVYVSGGVDSSLNFLYPLVIIIASILLPRLWAYLTTALAFILYGTVLELTYFEVVPSYSITHPSLRALQAVIFVNLCGYFAVAYLAGVLSSKLRQVDVKLEKTRGALADLQALHENIIESISAGIITTGLDGHITLANRAAQKLLEFSEQDLIARPVQRLFVDSLPQANSETGQAEVRFTAPNGFRKTFRATASMLSVPGRKSRGYVYTFDDLTGIRRLEREVRMQDRLAAVGRLAAAIAHEIRNPLTSIAGSVSMLGCVPDLNEEHRKLLEIVTRESARLNNIITDFLNYSRTKQYQFSRVDLIPLLEDTLTLLQHRLLADKSGIVVERRYSVKEAWSLADGDKVKQVFWNFCENAVRAMPSGGRITVSLETFADDWQIDFADTGPGIDPKVIDRIFEPFQSQFEGGTGLGLAIVYQIVQAHEGKVWARSKAGEGSVFVLRLRRSVAERNLHPAYPERHTLESRGNASVAAAAGGGARG